MCLPKQFATKVCPVSAPESLPNRVAQKVCQKGLPRSCTKKRCPKGLPNIFARKVCQIGLPEKGVPESVAKTISMYSFPGSWIPHVPMEIPLFHEKALLRFKPTGIYFEGF